MLFSSLPGLGCQQLFAQVRRQKRNLLAVARFQGQVQQTVIARVLWISFAPVSHQAQPRVLQRRPEARAPARLLRDHRQRQGFGQRQLRRRFAEVNAAGRFGTFDIAAHGRQVQVRLKDVVLAVARLQPQRQRHLLQFARHLAGVEVPQAPRQLHAQGRAALALAAAVGGHGRPQQRRGIDPRVPVEIAVFLEQQGLDQ